MKQLICSLVLLITASGLYAQVATTLIKAGSGFANVHYKYNNSNDIRGRAIWYAGLAEHIELTSQFFLQPELLYSLRGYRQQASASSMKATVNFNYLSLPLLAGYKPTQKLSLMAGPEVGYMMFATSHVNGSSTNITSYVNYRVNVDADAGIDFDLTSSLTFETRFVIGLSAIERIAPIGSTSNDDIRKDGYHQSLQVGLALKL